MTEFWQWAAVGAGTILLALLAGAGGSALLELLWRSRRDEKRAASLLTAEVAMNTELLLLQAHARQGNPTIIPGDFKMSRIGWEAVAPLVSELPPKLVRTLVMLYGQYDALNRNVVSFGESLDRYKDPTTGSIVGREGEEMLARIVDVFNTGLDSTLKRSQEVLPQLAALAGIKETDAEKANIPNYQQVVTEHLAMRKAHVEALMARNKRSDS